MSPESEKQQPQDLYDPSLDCFCIDGGICILCRLREVFKPFEPNDKLKRRLHPQGDQQTLL
jgi:hypothetical protein